MIRLSDVKVRLQYRWRRFGVRVRTIRRCRAQWRTGGLEGLVPRYPRRRGISKPIVARFDQPQASPNGGAILLKAVDDRLGLTWRLASAIRDRRHPGKVAHPLRDLLRQRVFGLALGALAHLDKTWFTRGAYTTPSKLTFRRIHEGEDYVNYFWKFGPVRDPRFGWRRPRRLLGRRRPDAPTELPVAGRAVLLTPQLPAFYS